MDSLLLTMAPYIVLVLKLAPYFVIGAMIYLFLDEYFNGDDDKYV